MLYRQIMQSDRCRKSLAAFFLGERTLTFVDNAVFFLYFCCVTAVRQEILTVCRVMERLFR